MASILDTYILNGQSEEEDDEPWMLSGSDHYVNLDTQELISADEYERRKRRKKRNVGNDIFNLNGDSNSNSNPYSQNIPEPPVVTPYKSRYRDSVIKRKNPVTRKNVVSKRDDNKISRPTNVPITGELPGVTDDKWKIKDRSIIGETREEKQPVDLLVKIHVRSFAPFETFGAGNWLGDNRGFTTDLDVSSRLEQETSIDLKTTKFETRYSGSTSIGLGLISRGMPVVARSEPNVTEVERGVGPLIHTHLSGNDDAIVPGADGTIVEDLQSPDIDVFSTFVYKKPYGRTVINKNTEDLETVLVFEIQGRMYGDAFPSAEQFIEDKTGQTIFLNVSPAMYGPNTGPFYALFGANTRPMGGFDIKIAMDLEGNFLGVFTPRREGGTEYAFMMSIEEWNQPFFDANPVF